MIENNIEISSESVVDSRLESALSSANYRISLMLQKENAQVKLANALVYSSNGGTFNITPELISFVFSLTQISKSEEIILNDSNKNPIKVKKSEFLENIVDKYNEAMLDYLSEVNKIKSARTTSKVVDW